MILVALVVGGYAATQALSGDGPSQETASPSAGPDVDAFPSASPAGAVLPGLAADAAVPSADGVAATLGPLLADPDLGSRVTATVVDAVSGAVLFDREAQLPLVPASSAKLLTAVAALEVLEPQHRLTTQVTRGPTADQIVLVGAGDATLSTQAAPPESYPRRASLAELAAGTAAVLTAQGVTSVTLAYDASLFAGPLVNPEWQPGYVQGGAVAPVSALSVDGGRVRPGSDERVADPALTAAVRFVEALGASGIAVTGAPVPGVAPDGAEVIASVQSPTVAQLVETMLVGSDNDVAEALLRLVGARRTVPADVASAAAAVVDANGRAGVAVTGVSLRDGSGLARSNAVPARTLGSVLDVAADNPSLGTIVAKMPVAGFTGTLADRFDNPGDRSGAGVVRAKTGTLNGVSSLSGTVVSAEGRLLAFAFMADQVPLARTLDAREAFDAAASALAGCGCR